MSKTKTVKQYPCKKKKKMPIQAGRLFEKLIHDTHFQLSQSRAHSGTGGSVWSIQHRTLDTTIPI